jgi:hypothetical protein
VTSDTISKFNRDIVWLTTGVLGTVVFAALVLVILECQPKARMERLLQINVRFDETS